MVSAASTPGPSAPDMRVDVGVIDGVTDRAMRIRILTHGIARFSARLDELASLAEKGVGESGPAQVLAVLVASLRREALALERSQRQLARGAEAQLDTLLELQVQPLRPFLLSLARHARELARELGKELEVDLSGEDTALDRRIVQDLEEAVIHLVRNAVDHGIEGPSVREDARKPRVGRLRIEAAPSGTHVRLTISDDGAGIDTDAVVGAAIDRGILPGGSRPTADEALCLLLRSGFSTRRTVSELSGRGIGLDAVAAAAARLGGELSISSQRGEGTTVVLDVPVARRGERVVIVRVGHVKLGIPAAAIEKVECLLTREVVRRDGRSFAEKGGRLVAFVPLAETLGIEAAERQVLLTGRSGGEEIAAALDAVEGAEEVLVRRASALTERSTLLDGVALLASGEPVAVVSPLALAPRTAVPPSGAPAAAASRRRLRVLLVEDSFVTREMERRLLEDAGFEVVAAGNAAQALEQLGCSAFDCIVTDIEMPETDGLELTRRVRAAPDLTTLPVVVVSTRDRPEDRLGALQAGADAYFVKQGLDALELVSIVRRLGGR
jgi:chemotaxis protein histidine kinase CheA